MKGKDFVWTMIAVAVAIVAVLLVRAHWHKPPSIRRTVPIEGAVIRRDPDTRKELPIENVAVTASDGVVSASTESDASGYFRLELQRQVWSGQPIVVHFQHADFEPFDLNLEAGRLLIDDKLHVVAMEPVPELAKTNVKESVVSNIRVRYTINSRTEKNVGSAVRTFQVVNQGNVPCEKHLPCSPDKKWKASKGSASLDAGQDNSFGNVRASCIAGPCPFTSIDSSGFEHGGRYITVSALDWSNTATFLLEAEVFHTAISSNVRESYPVIFGRTLNFTLPPTQEGVSLEGEIDGAPMVFPLGPDLYLSWANCSARTNNEKDKTTVYRCELKPGYRF
ncbi:hypothetical protein P8936_13270 [Edaphobacter paludis]|uniref:Carboxypeptidase regulatory-like domain-containing protein n=1 Tax=Edaphobacter paludis TaxID=3035702 RepID=A0AAU7D5L2_9BACT